MGDSESSESEDSSDEEETPTFLDSQGRFCEAKFKDQRVLEREERAKTERLVKQIQESITALTKRKRKVIV
jgi:hypothetical protein